MTKVFGYFKVVRRRKTALLRAPALAHPAPIQHDASCVGWRDVGSAIANFETDSQVSQISGSGVEGKNTEADGSTK